MTEKSGSGEVVEGSTTREPSLFQEHPVSERMRAALRGMSRLESESDRGCVLVGAAILDETLRAVLEAYLSPDKDLVCSMLEGGSSPLSSFSARIKLCRLLGAISTDLYRDLDVIRKMRNEAAHFEWRHKDGFDFTFETASIRARCRSLRSVSTATWATNAPGRIVFSAFVVMLASRLQEVVRCALHMRRLDSHGLENGTDRARSAIREDGALTDNGGASRRYRAILQADARSLGAEPNPMKFQVAGLQPSRRREFLKGHARRTCCDRHCRSGNAYYRQSYRQRVLIL